MDRDQEIYDEACERLSHHGQLDASGINVEVRQGQIYLRGQITSQHSSNLAQDALQTIPGVRSVVNELVVGETPGSSRTDPMARSEVTETGTVNRSNREEQ